MLDTSRLIDEQVAFITSHQLTSGAIPWYRGGITDPWDHIECAIALDLAGRHDEAVKAYCWMKGSQNDDGSWYSRYVDGHAEDLDASGTSSTQENRRKGATVAWTTADCMI